MIATQREEWEKGKQAIHDLLVPYVRKDGPAWIMRDRYQAVVDIVDGVWRLVKREGWWEMEGKPGELIDYACGIAWKLHLLTNEPVRLKFNGVHIEMVDPQA